MENGKVVEEKIKNNIFSNLYQDEVADLTQFIFNNHTHKSQTIKALQNKNIKCVYQGFVTDDEFFGISDFIVPRQTLNILLQKYTNKSFTQDENDNSYYIVDVKSSCKIINGKVSEYTSNYDWIHFQLSFYRQLLKSYDVEVSTKGYIITFDKDKNNITLGEIKLHPIDTRLLSIYMKTIEEEGKDWSLYPLPSHDYLYPNMKNAYDDEWRQAKTEIAKKIGEWTMIPYVGMSLRKQLWKREIKTFRDDDVLLKLKKYDEFNKINKNIVEVNQLSVFCETRGGEGIKKELNEKINRKDIVLYLDIEELIHDGHMHAFMICIYSSVDKKYRTIMCENTDEILGKKIINDTSDIIEEYTSKYDKVKIVHYSGNESKIFRQNDKVEYIDLYDILKNNKFAMTGLYSLKLKEIYKCIERNKEECEIENGLEALIVGQKYYSSNDEEEKKKYKIDLEKYIKRDVDILLKVIKYFNRY